MKKNQVDLAKYTNIPKYIFQVKYTKTILNKHYIMLESTDKNTEADEYHQASCISRWRSP